MKHPSLFFWGGKVSYRVHPKAWIRADVATHAAHLKPKPPSRVSPAAPAPRPKEMEAAEIQRREKEWMAKDRDRFIMT